MAGVALDEATISQSTVANHITYRSYDYIGESEPYCVFWDGDGNCVDYDTDSEYAWVNHTTNATITGTVDASVTNVLINGKAPIIVGDNTVEDDSYTLPNGGQYVSGSHSDATSGSVTVGNTKSVFINGSLVALSGASVRTHASTNATINGGVSTSVNIG